MEDQEIKFHPLPPKKWVPLRELHPGYIVEQKLMTREELEKEFPHLEIP